MIRETGSIQLSTLPGGPRFAQTSKTIQKVKHKLKQQMVSVRSLAKDYSISKSSTHRILKDNLKLCAYKMRIEPKLTEEHKNKRKKFVNWLGHNFLEKRTQCASYFQTKKYLISTVCTIPKINVFGLLVEMKQMKKAASKRNKFPQKVIVTKYF